MAAASSGSQLGAPLPVSSRRAASSSSPHPQNRDDPRLARALLAALNPLLLAQGRGLAREALTPLLAALLPLAGRALRGPQREARVREEAVLQLRVQLAMRPLLADLATMARWVLRELEAPHFCFWCVWSSCRRRSVNGLWTTHGTLTPEEPEVSPCAPPAPAGATPRPGSSSWARRGP